MLCRRQMTSEKDGVDRVLRRQWTKLQLLALAFWVMSSLVAFYTPSLRPGGSWDFFGCGVLVSMVFWSIYTISRPNFEEFVIPNLLGSSGVYFQNWDVRKYKNDPYTWWLYSGMDLRVTARVGRRKDDDIRPHPSTHTPTHHWPQRLHTCNNQRSQCRDRLSSIRRIWNNIRFHCSITLGINIQKHPIRIDGWNWRWCSQPKCRYSPWRCRG